MQVLHLWKYSIHAFLWWRGNFFLSKCYFLLTRVADVWTIFLHNLFSCTIINKEILKERCVYTENIYVWASIVAIISDYTANTLSLLEETILIFCIHFHLKHFPSIWLNAGATYTERMSLFDCFSMKNNWYDVRTIQPKGRSVRNPFKLESTKQIFQLLVDTTFFLGRAQLKSKNNVRTTSIINAIK